jgi:hypothetical protein
MHCAGTILRETRSLHDILEDEDRDYGSDVVWAAVRQAQLSSLPCSQPSTAHLAWC